MGVTLGMAALGSANAWYGGPFYGGGPGYAGPYGAGPYGSRYGSSAMTHDRQRLMRDHGRAMRDLEAMFEGRMMFDRTEATKLAREIEAGAGENMWRLYAPGSVAPGSRSAPNIWGNFETFKANAQAVKEAAGKVADALEKRPTGADYQRGVWVPPHSMGYGRGGPWGQRGGAIAKEAVGEFNRLTVTCHACHGAFRGPRW